MTWETVAAIATGVGFFRLFLPAIRTAGVRATSAGAMGHKEADRIAFRLGEDWSALDVLDCEAHGRLDDMFALLDKNR